MSMFAFVVPHAAEIGYIYGNALDFTPEGRTLTTYMMDYWISFTVNLDPNDKKGSERAYIFPLNWGSVVD